MDMRMIIIMRRGGGMDMKAYPMRARSRLSLLATLLVVRVMLTSLVGWSGPRSGTLLKLLAAESCHAIG